MMTRMSRTKLTAPPTGPHGVEDLGHGHSIAIWVAVGIAFVGFALGTYAVISLNWPLLYVAIGLLVVSLIVGRVLSLMGFGAYTRGEGDSPQGKDALGVK